MAIKNLKMHLILALLIFFNIAFWLYIASRKKQKKNKKKATVDHCFIPGVNLPIWFLSFGYFSLVRNFT
jgi:nitrate/nitrite transporter NarK